LKIKISEKKSKEKKEDRGKRRSKRINYKEFKFIKFPSWVGIEPEMPFSMKVLFSYWKSFFEFKEKETVLQLC